MSFIKRLASDTAWYGLSSIVSRIIMFLILAPYFTEILENNEYGIHGIMYAFAAVLLSLYTFRLETAFFRYGSARDKLEASFWTSSLFIFVLGLFFTLIISWNSVELAGFLTRAEDSRYVNYFAAIIFLDAISAIPFARLRLDRRPKRFAFIKIMNIVITLIVMLALLEGLKGLSSNVSSPFYGFYNPDHKLDYIFISNIVGSAGTFLLLIPMYFKSRIQWDGILFKKLIRYSAPLLIVGVAGSINELTDRFFVKEWMPGGLTDKEKMAEAGTYTAAARIAVIINLFTQAYNYAAEPFFFKNKEEGGSITVYARSAEAFMLVGTIGFLFLSLNLHTIKYIINENYWSGIYVTPILMISSLLLGLYYNTSIWYKLTDKTSYGALISTIGAVITIGLNYLLLPVIGLTGAALTSVVAYFLMNIITILIGKKHYSIPYRYQRIAFYPMLAIGLYYAYYFLASNPLELNFVNFIVSNLVGVLFLIFVYFMERDFIMGTLKKK